MENLTTMEKEKTSKFQKTKFSDLPKLKDQLKQAKMMLQRAQWFEAPTFELNQAAKILVEADQKLKEMKTMSKEKDTVEELRQYHEAINEMSIMMVSIENLASMYVVQTNQPELMARIQSVKSSLSNMNATLTYSGNQKKSEESVGA